MKLDSVVEAIYRYPLKSAGPEILLNALADPFVGIVGDRVFTLVDDGGRFITARRFPMLSKISCFVDNSSEVHISIEGQYLSLPLNHFNLPVDVSIWRRHVSAQSAPSYVNILFSNLLGIKTRLCFLRQIDTVNNFYDTSLIHLISTDSHLKLQDSLGKDFLDPIVFRPNIIVSSLSSFKEEVVRSLYIGENKFDVVEATERCSMVQILAKYKGYTHSKSILKKIRNLSVNKNVNFGLYIRPVQVASISVTDTIKVISNKETQELIPV